jgi:hypothetical protein
LNAPSQCQLETAVTGQPREVYINRPSSSKAALPPSLKLRTIPNYSVTATVELTTGVPQVVEFDHNNDGVNVYIINLTAAPAAGIIN